MHGRQRRLPPGLFDPNVTLVPFGVKDLTGKSVLDVNGDEHELDMVVLATGPRPTTWASAFPGPGSRRYQWVASVGWPVMDRSDTSVV